MKFYDVIYWLDIVVFIGLLVWLKVKKIFIKSNFVSKLMVIVVICFLGLIFLGNLVLSEVNCF